MARRERPVRGWVGQVRDGSRQHGVDIRLRVADREATLAVGDLALGQDGDHVAPAGGELLLDHVALDIAHRAVVALPVADVEAMEVQQDLDAAGGDVDTVRDDHDRPALRALTGRGPLVIVAAETGRQVVDRDARRPGHLGVLCVPAAGARAAVLRAEPRAGRRRTPGAREPRPAAEPDACRQPGDGRVPGALLERENALGQRRSGGRPVDDRALDRLGCAFIAGVCDRHRPTLMDAQRRRGNCCHQAAAAAQLGGSPRSSDSVRPRCTADRPGRRVIRIVC